MEDGERTAWIFVHPHPGFDVMAPVRLLGDLQHAALVADAIIVADQALLLHAQDIFEIADKGQESAAFVLRRHREAGVEIGDVMARQPSVRRLDSVDAGQPKLTRSMRPRASGE